MNPAVPYEVDAQLFNLGNAPLTLAAFANDSIAQTNTEYSVVTAQLNTPACSPSIRVEPGNWCYLGLSLLDGLTPPACIGPTNGTATVVSDATNAPASPSGSALRLRRPSLRITGLPPASPWPSHPTPLPQGARAAPIPAAKRSP